MSLSAHLAVQRNAFSTAVAAPKVCDGAVGASLAERISNAGIHASEQGQQTFLLMPTICGHVLNINNDTAGTVTLPPANFNDDVTVTYKPTIHAIDFVTLDDTPAIPTNAAPPTVQTGGPLGSNDPDMSVIMSDPNATQRDVDVRTEMNSSFLGDTNAKLIYSLTKRKDAPDQYRLVSAALRLNSINAADSNQGWFEAVRIRPSWAIEGCSVYNKDSRGDCVIGPQLNFWEQGILKSANWANDPSYVTGRLRDLGKHTFYLQNIGKSRNFHKWPQVAKAPAFDTFAEQPCGFDPNFDCIAIRISSAKSTVSTLQQTIHYHVTKNWETIYDSQSFSSRFQTATLSAKNSVEYTDRQMTRDPKASMVRSASSYSYRY